MWYVGYTIQSNVRAPSHLAPSITTSDLWEEPFILCLEHTQKTNTKKKRPVLHHNTESNVNITRVSWSSTSGWTREEIWKNKKYKVLKKKKTLKTMCVFWIYLLIFNRFKGNKLQQIFQGFSFNLKFSVFEFMHFVWKVNTIIVDPYKEEESTWMFSVRLTEERI